MENKPRYAIVRVDMRCPYGLEETFCSNDCHRCGLGYGYYGDTKEQLIRKITLALYRKEIKWWKHQIKGLKITKELSKNIYEYCLDDATEIVNVLGGNKWK